MMMEPLRKNHGTATGIWLRWLRQEGWILFAIPVILIVWVVGLVFGL